MEKKVDVRDKEEISKIREGLEETRWEEIGRDLASVLNRYNVDAAIGMADYALAEFLVDVLKGLEEMGSKPSNTPPNINTPGVSPTSVKGAHTFGEASK